MTIPHTGKKTCLGTAFLFSSWWAGSRCGLGAAPLSCCHIVAICVCHCLSEKVGFRGSDAESPVLQADSLPTELQGKPQKAVLFLGWMWSSEQMTSNCLEGRARLQEGPALSDASIALKRTPSLKTLMRVILEKAGCLQPALLKSLLPQ